LHHPLQTTPHPRRRKRRRRTRRKMGMPCSHHHHPPQREGGKARKRAHFPSKKDPTSSPHRGNCTLPSDRGDCTSSQPSDRGDCTLPSDRGDCTLPSDRGDCTSSEPSDRGDYTLPSSSQPSSDRGGGFDYPSTPPSPSIADPILSDANPPTPPPFWEPFPLPFDWEDGL
ncbi:unnamed protein product, partial [Cyprideis torosa]